MDDQSGNRNGIGDHTSQIIRRVIDGDTRALDSLVDWLGPLMASWARWQLRNAASQLQLTAEDLVQDIWLRMLPKLADLRPHPDSRRWTPALLAVVRRALRNRVIDARREAARRALDTCAADRPADDISADDIPAGNSGPFSRAVRSERRQVLETALEQLNERDRALYVRRIFERTSIGELAAEFGLSEDGVLKARQRARQRLSHHLAPRLLDMLERA